MLVVIFVVACILAKLVSMTAVLIAKPFCPCVLAVLAFAASHHRPHIGGGEITQFQFDSLKHTLITVRIYAIKFLTSVHTLRASIKYEL